MCPRRRSSRRPGRRRPDPRRSRRRRRAVSTVSPQPGGTRPGARSASGARTNRRSRIDGWGTSRRRAAAPGSIAAVAGRPSGGRSIARRARPNTSRSRSSSRGPQRPRCWRPKDRSMPLSATSSARAPTSRVGAGPARRARRPHSGSRAGPSRRRVSCGTAARRHGGARRAGRPAPPRRRSASAARRRRSPRARCTPEPVASQACSLGGEGARLQSPRAARDGPNPAPAAAPGSGELAASLTAARRGTPTGSRAGSGRPARQTSGSRMGAPDGRTFGERLRELAADLAAGHRARRARVRLHPAGAAAGRRGPAGRRQAAASGGRWPTASTRPTSSRSATRRISRPCRTCRATTRCRAGSRRRRAIASTTCAGAGAWRSTSTRRSTSILVGRACRLRRRRLAGSFAIGSTRIRAVVGSTRRAELVVAGRTSAATLRWLERGHGVADAGARRGARAPGDRARRPGDGPRNRRPPRSALGLLLDERGPAALGTILAELGDAAVVDTRVLLAHRLGADESRWPSPEDRYASDLLLADADRRSVAARAHGLGARRGDPGPPRRAHARRARPAPRGTSQVTGPRGPREARVPDEPAGCDRRLGRGRRAARPGARARARSRRATRSSSSASPTRSAGPARCPSRGSCTAPCTSSTRATTSPTAAGPGRTGDFLTAPESHPIFGWTLARQLEEVWDALGRPSASWFASTAPARARSPRASSTACAAPARRCSGAIRYQAIDIARPRLEAFTARLREAGFEPNLEPPDGRPATGAVLANELLDALPVHRVEGAADGLRERFVTLDREPGEDPPIQRSPFTTVLGPPSTPGARRAPRGRGHRAPARPAGRDLPRARAWLRPRDRSRSSAASCSSSTTARPADELYAPERGSTLRAYHRHRVHARPARRDRAAGPDGPRRPHGRRARGARRRPRRRSAARARPSSSPRSASATCSSGSSRTWRRRWRPTSKRGRRWSACSTPARPAPSRSSGSVAGCPPSRRCGASRRRA